jgi:hypothetical protein
MKPVVLAVLLILAVTSTVSDDTPVASVVSDDTPVTSVVSGDTTQSGKLLFGNETCLPVILQELQLY